MVSMHLWRSRSEDIWTEVQLRRISYIRLIFKKIITGVIIRRSCTQLDVMELGNRIG